MKRDGVPPLIFSPSTSHPPHSLPVFLPFSLSYTHAHCASPSTCFFPSLSLFLSLARVHALCACHSGVQVVSEFWAQYEGVGTLGGPNSQPRRDLAPCTCLHTTRVDPASVLFVPVLRAQPRPCVARGTYAPLSMHRRYAESIPSCTYAHVRAGYYVVSAPSERPRRLEHAARPASPRD